MEREPQLPIPHDRAEAWRQDLEIARRKLLKYDRSFSEGRAVEFQRAIDELAASVGQKTDDEMIAEWRGPSR
jgi:hypothetical protein